jgi:ABC-type Na+ efflux pump permease subunit
MSSFDRTFGFVKFFIIFVFIIMIGGFIFKGAMVVNAKKNNQTIYQIDVNTYNAVESYTTTDYTRDEKTGCIKFKDEFGLKHTVCNNYSITEY